MFGWYMAQIIVLVAGPIALNNIGWRFLLVLIVPTFFYWFAIYFLFPETQQRSLEDINEAFGEKVAVHYHGATAAEQEEYNKVIEHEHQEDVRRESLNLGNEVKAFS